MREQAAVLLGRSSQTLPCLAAGSPQLYTIRTMHPDPEPEQTATPQSWESFLDAYAATIYAAIRSFSRTHDERMDLFLFVCDGLKANGMRRVRRFRYRPEAPCRFTTYLAVVVRNLALDHRRARSGRFREFTNTRGLDETDRLVYLYRMRDGISLPEVREKLERRHAIRIDSGALAERAARVERLLSASQRWRLLSRWARRQPAASIDSVTSIAESQGIAVPLTAAGRDPERSLGDRDAERAFAAAVAALSACEQLILALRFRDGLDVATSARAAGVSAVQVERATRDALAAIRTALGAARITREELEGRFGAWWSTWEARS